MTDIKKKLINKKDKKMLITKNIEEADLITHNGTFHADEVFSTVLLSRILKKETLKICRTSNIKGNIKMRRVCLVLLTHPPQLIFLILLKSLEILYFTRIL